MSRISAWKPCKGGITPCNSDDAEAVRWDVRWPNSYNLTIDFDNKYMADRVAAAIDDSIQHGKKLAKEELGRWISGGNF